MKSLVKIFVNKIDSIKKVIEMIKEKKINKMKKEQKEQNEDVKVIFKYIFEKDNISLNVLYAPAVLKATGILGACVVQYRGINYAYVDDYFEKLTEDEQKAILLHEIHHILHEDSFSKIDIIKRALGFKSAIKIEIMADEYAVKNSSKEIFINALNKITLDASISSLKEIRIRIRHLENMDC